jgi:hypothetical protein
MQFVRKQGGRYYLHPVEPTITRCSRMSRGDPADRDAATGRLLATGRSLHRGGPGISRPRAPIPTAGQSLDDLAMLLAEFRHALATVRTSKAGTACSSPSTVCCSNGGITGFRGSSPPAGWTSRRAIHCGWACSRCSAVPNRALASIPRPFADSNRGSTSRARSAPPARESYLLYQLGWCHGELGDTGIGRRAFGSLAAPRRDSRRRRRAGRHAVAPRLVLRQARTSGAVGGLLPARGGRAA